MDSQPRAQTAPEQAGSAQHTVYYDGSCPLCTMEIGHYAARAEGDALRFVDVSRDDAALGEGLDRDAAMGRFHVRRPDGALVSGARGFVAIWTALPGWRRLARVARLPGVIHILELAYRGFLPLRPAMSRLAGAMGAKAENPGGAR